MLAQSAYLAHVKRTTPDSKMYHFSFRTLWHGKGVCVCVCAGGGEEGNKRINIAGNEVVTDDYGD